MEYIGIQKKNGGVVEALQQAILSGQIPAGTEMTQNELAESLGVSRMPVREALMILEYQGLIIRLPNNRIKAADLNEDALRQILALGAQLERQDNPVRIFTFLSGSPFSSTPLLIINAARFGVIM